MNAILIGIRLALKGYRIRLPLGLRLALRAYPGARLIRLLRDAERVRRAVQAELFTINLKLLKEFTVIYDGWKVEPWYRAFDRDELRQLYNHYRHLRGDPRGQRWPRKDML